MAGEQVLRRAGLRGRRAVRLSGDDREGLILATAERLLAERSLLAISVDDLARGAGISRPSFYFYFASKDAVLLTLLNRVIAEADTTCTEAFEAPAADRRERWRRGIAAYFTTFGTHRTITLAAAEAVATSPEIRELWGRGFDGWVQMVTATIEAERRRGAAPPGIPARDLAIVLNAMNERVLSSTYSGHGSHVAEADVVDVLLDVWLRAIYGTATP